MYDRKPRVMTSLRKRRKPSSIDACRTLVISLGNATSGELAILRISATNTGSGRTRSHSSRRDVSVPDKTLIALSATGENGGRLSNAGSISRGSASLDGLAMRVPITNTPIRHGVRGRMSQARAATATKKSVGGLPKLHTLSARSIRTAYDERGRPNNQTWLSDLHSRTSGVDFRAKLGAILMWASVDTSRSVFFHGARTEISHPRPRHKPIPRHQIPQRHNR